MREVSVAAQRGVDNRRVTPSGLCDSGTVRRAAFHSLVSAAELCAWGACADT